MVTILISAASLNAGDTRGRRLFQCDIIQKQNTKKLDQFQETKKKMLWNSRKFKENCHSNLNIKDVTDSRKFWSTVKQFYSDTSKTVHNIILSDNDKMLKDEEKAAKALIYYFTNLTKKLKLIVITCNDTVNSVKHPNSIGKIKGFYKDDPSIEFKRITINKLLKIIKELSSNKVNVIPTKIIKNSALKSRCLYFKFPKFYQKGWHNPSIQKRWRHRPGKLCIYKYVIKRFKKFWKIIYNQILEFMNPKLPDYVTVFRKTITLSMLTKNYWNLEIKIKLWK